MELPSALRSERARSFGYWVAFVVGSWVFLRPVLLTTVYADDFVNPFVQFPSTGLSPIEMTQFGWNGAKSSGHFNVVGQIIGAAITSLWTVLMGVFGMRYSTIYAASKLLVFILTVLATSAFARETVSCAGRVLGVWRSRVFVAVALYSMLQIHIAWSNDPVTTYPASGFASAAIGFLLLTLALKALNSGSVRGAWVVAALGTFAALYYEINVAAVAAIVPLVCWAWWHAARSDRALRPVMRVAAPMLGVPFVVVIVMRLWFGSSNTGYTGTEVAGGSEQLRSLMRGLVSTFPGAAWDLSRDWINAPMPVQRSAVVVLVVLGGVLAALWKCSPSREPEGDVAWIGVALMLAAPLVYWLGATVIQTATQKVQDEAPRIGYVYNYYAMGVTALAVIVVVVAVLIPRRWWNPWVRGLLGAAAIALVAVQYNVNWNVSLRFNELTAPSRALLVSFTEDRTEEQRCEALLAWAYGPWPDYYEESMITGLDAAYRYFHDEPFCSGFIRPE